MRSLVLIPLLLALGNCGGPATGRGWTSYGPPAMTLESRAGTQHAVQGSYCVQGKGTGRCADSTYPDARQLSVVRPGETVRIQIAGSEGVQVTLHPLGCPRRILGHAAVGPDGGWRVTAAPGLYDVEVFSRFTGAGVSGDTTGGIGLWVHRTHRLEVVSATSVHAAGCR